VSDENREPTVDQKNHAEEKTQLSEEALSKISGGGTPTKNTASKTDTLPTETVTLNYSKVEW